MSGRRSPSQIAAEKERLEGIRRADLKDLKALMELPEFRRYVRRYLDATCVFQTTFTGSSETFFKEGKRSVGTTMFGELMEAADDKFLLMMREPTNADSFPPVDPDDD